MTHTNGESVPYTIVLDDGCEVPLWDHGGGTAPFKVGDWTGCVHSPPVAWDPDTGEERKHARDRQVVAVRPGHDDRSREAR